MTHQDILQANIGSLKGLAGKFISTYGLKISDFLLVCINVNDPTWEKLVEKLMPGNDWSEIRNASKIPIARGIVDKKSFEPLLQVLCQSPIPELEENEIYVAVFHEGSLGLFVMSCIWTNNLHSTGTNNLLN